ncbi:MAG: hypothetical protein ABIF10_06695 [Candidatus Woesearchaeota archaeon]
MINAVRKPHMVEKTKYLKGIGVLHYTCNNPEIEILRKEGIRSLDQELKTTGLDLFVIPFEVYKRYGYQITKDPIYLTIISENLLRTLERSSEHQ